MDIANANSERLAHFTIESAPIAIYWVNSHAQITHVNKAACSMLGYTNKELVGSKVPEINPEFSIKGFKLHFEELVEKEKLVLETTQLTKDGKEIPVEIISYIIDFEGNKFACSFITDISSKRQMEQEIHLNHERWKLGLEILNEGVWDWDINTGKTVFSQQFADNLGYQQKELLYILDRLEEIIHPDDIDKYRIRLQDHLKGLTDKYESEHRLKLKSGEYRWFKDRGIVLSRNDKGKATRMIGSSLDITERLEAENRNKKIHKEFVEQSKQALAYSQVKFQNILKFSNDAIIVLESKGQTIAEANAKTAELLGVSEQELIGDKISTFLPGQQEMIDELLNAVMKNKKGLTDHLIFSNSRGETMAAEVSASYFSMDQEEGIFVIIQLISEEKHVEKTLSQMLEGAISKSHTDFIPSFIEQTASVLNVRCVGISQILDHNQEEIEVISVWDKGHFTAPFRIKVDGVPSKRVFKEGLTYYKEGVASMFPNDSFLQKIKGEGYLGVPVHDSVKRLIGHFFVIDDKPMEKRPWVESLLKISANRIGLELERKRIESELKVRLELEGLVSDISSRFINTSATNLPESIDWALSKIGQYVKADRSYIFKLSDDGESASTTHEWVAENITSLKSDFQDVLRKDYPWPFELLDSKKLLLIPDIDDTDEDIASFKEVFNLHGIKSMLNVPMVVQNRTYGFLGFDSEKTKNWSINDIVLLKLVAEVIINTIERVNFETSLKQMNDSLEKQVKDRTIELSKTNNELQDALEEVENLKDKLEAENIYLKEEIESGDNFENIISQDKEFKKVLIEMEHVAKTSSTVLILGETGTGKEVISKAIHNLSLRKDKPLIKINCAALPATLIESELFGYEKGAFTGATGTKQGRFELANGGTLFLDEVGEMPLELQPKLLRALQEGEFERLGGTKTIKVDVRLIAATNKDLGKAVEEGTFRSDLYYRLNVFPINVPPLRNRKDDIRLLVNHFVQKYNLKLGKQINKIPQSIINQLEKYNWPGNVRELENIIERALIISPSNQLKLGDWFMTNQKPLPSEEKFESLNKVERNYIIKVLQKTNWKISGENGAAHILGLKPTTLESRMKKLEIQRP